MARYGENFYGGGISFGPAELVFFRFAASNGVAITDVTPAILDIRNAVAGGRGAVVPTAVETSLRFASPEGIGELAGTAIFLIGTLLAVGGGSGDGVVTVSPALRLLAAANWTSENIRHKYAAGGSLNTYTFTRSSSARYTSEAGLVLTAATNAPRDAHYVNGLRTLLLEPSRTNIVLWNRDLTNAAWVKTTMTALKNQVGTDGVVNSASSITATAASATVLQTITATVNTRIQSAYVKRLVGTGTVEMTQNGGTTWTPITVTGAWTRVNLVAASVTNPVVGFRIATSGDSIAVDLVQNEIGSTITSPNPTTTAQVAHNAEIMTVPWSFSQEATTFYVKFVDQGLFAAGSGARVFQISASTDLSPRVYLAKTSATVLQMLYHNGTANVSVNLTVPWTMGDTVEVRGSILSTGAVTWAYRVNGGVETVVGTSAAPTGGLGSAAWSTPTLLGIASLPGSAISGGIAIAEMKFAKGVHTTATMISEVGPGVIVGDGSLNTPTRILWYTPSALPTGDTAITALPLFHMGGYTGALLSSGNATSVPVLWNLRTGSLNGDALLASTGVLRYPSLSAISGDGSVVADGLPILVGYANWQGDNLVLTYEPGGDTSGFTKTRPTTALYSSASGVVQTAGINVLRDAHYLGATRTMLVESASTNLVLQSENFGVTWTVTGTPTRTGAAHTASGITLDLIGDDSAVALEGYLQTVTFTADAINIKALSLYVKQGTSTSSLFKIRDLTALTDRLSAVLTWSGGLPVVTMGNGTYHGYEVLAGGVFRLKFGSTAVTAANTNQIQILPATTLAAAVANTGNIYVGGVQAENWAAPTSYKPTTTATVGRSADILLMPFPYAPMAMTIYVKFIEQGTIAQGNGTWLVRVGGSGTSGGRVLRVSATTGTPNVYRVVHEEADATAQVVSALGVSTAVGDTVELLIKLFADGSVQISQRVNGGAEVVAVASGAKALAGSWLAPSILLGSNAFTACRVARGNQTMANMASGTGTSSYGEAFLSGLGLLWNVRTASINGDAITSGVPVLMFQRTASPLGDTSITSTSVLRSLRFGALSGDLVLNTPLTVLWSTPSAISLGEGITITNPALRSIRAGALLGDTSIRDVPWFLLDGDTDIILATGGAVIYTTLSTNLVLQSEALGTAPWITVGTSVVTSVAGDTSTSVTLALLTDDSTSVLEYIYQTISGLTTNATKAVSFYIKQGSSTSSVVRFRDVTAGTNRLFATITWSAGAPAVAMTTGSFLGADSFGSGVYRLRFTTTSVTVANSNRVEFFPAALNSLAVLATGNAYYGGLQVENTAVPGEYARTTTAAASVTQASFIVNPGLVGGGVASLDSSGRSIDGSNYFVVVDPSRTQADRGTFAIVGRVIDTSAVDSITIIE